MIAHGKLSTTKHRLSDIVNLLRQSVESTVENGRLAHTPAKTKMVRLKGTECDPILVEVYSGSGYVMSLLPDILQALF